MDMQILRSLFDCYVQASEILRLDEGLRAEVRGLRARLAPLQIGKDGELQEWLDDWKSLEPQHRHLSHLWGLYPGDEITPRRTPEYAEAARKSLVARGDGASGWSMAWKINLWARLLDGEHAYLLFKNLITQNTFPSMFSRGGQAMQVDGNFGGTAGVCEMLLQSHSDEIAILPALPRAWPSGSVRGFRARGGFELDIDWSNGKLDHAVIRSLLGNPCKVRYGEKELDFPTERGGVYQFSGDLNRQK
jgi:alpha-L-fucosidase 2